MLNKIEKYQMNLSNWYSNNWFEGSHDIETPLPLVNDILNQIPLENKSMLVLFNIEWVLAALYDRGGNPANITFYSDHPNKTKFVEALGVRVINNLMDINKKFDIVVGNPPFSKQNEGKTAGKRSVELYKKFFNMALEMASLTAMIIPSSDTKVQKTHNELIRNNANVIKHIDPSVFPGICMPMWYVIVDKKNTNRESSINWSLSSTGNNIPWVKGAVNMTHYKELTGGHGYPSPKKEDDVLIYHKVNGRHGLVKVYGPKESISKRQLFPSSGYAVLMPQTFTDEGWSRVEIVKCTGNETAFNGVNIVFVKTRKQANDLILMMKTEEFITGANSVKQGFNNMNLTCLKSIRTDFCLV